MTTTPTASPELSHLDHSEALARAATPGPWSWWTSNSTLRLTGADGRDGGVLYGYARQGDGDVNCAPNDQAFIAAANPAAVLALIALARRAQPEGEAPQAVPAMWVQYIDGVKTQNVARDDKEKATVESIHRTMAPGTKMTWRALYDHAPAATLSPLCGAQHAESGASDLDSFGAWKSYPLPDLNSDGHFDKDWLHREFVAFKAGRRAALAAQQAAAPEDADLRKDEATRLRRVVRALDIDHQVPGNDDRLRNCLFAVLGLIAGKLERAAQLDGGQEGSGSNG